MPVYWWHSGAIIVVETEDTKLINKKVFVVS